MSTKNIQSKSRATRCSKELLCVSLSDALHSTFEQSGIVFLIKWGDTPLALLFLSLISLLSVTFLVFNGSRKRSLDGGSTVQQTICCQGRITDNRNPTNPFHQATQGLPPPAKSPYQCTVHQWRTQQQRADCRWRATLDVEYNQGNANNHQRTNQRRYDGRQQNKRQTANRSG